MARKMSAQTRLMVVTANVMLSSKYMQENVDARTAICELVDNVLLNSNQYHGYNCYKEVDGRLRLAGEETTLIQFYVK